MCAQSTILNHKALNHILCMRTQINKCMNGQISISINHTQFWHLWLLVYIAIKLLNHYYKLLIDNDAIHIMWGLKNNRSLLGWNMDRSAMCRHMPLGAASGNNAMPSPRVCSTEHQPHKVLIGSMRKLWDRSSITCSCFWNMACSVAWHFGAVPFRQVLNKPSSHIIWQKQNGILM